VDPTITGQWDPITRRYDPNPGRGVALLDAKKLLAGTPWSGGFTLEFLWRAGAALRLAEEQSLATSWSRLGVSLKVVGYTTNDWFKALTTGRFQVVLVAPDNISFLGLDNFIQQDLTSPFIARPGNTEKPSNAQSNFAGISDGVIDHAAAAARATLDEKARTRYLRLVEEELVKKAYWDVLYGVPYCYLEDRRIANLSDSIGDSTAGIYWDEWEWRVK
jgi:ABC-type transport system substrate-binding protein